MAPGFDTLSDHDFQEEDDEEEIDFSDLREQYDVHMEEGLDTFCVLLTIEAWLHPADKPNRWSMACQSSTPNKNQN
jgi:hypothetical protein